MERNMNKTVRRILLVILIGIFCFSTGKVVYNKLQDAREQKASQELAALVHEIEAEDEAEDEGVIDHGLPTHYAPSGRLKQYDKLYEQNNDLAGWIRIPDSAIDYPVMQGRTNTEYLSKSPLGAITPSGSIFLDSMNRIDMTDPYMVIYGHHMEKGRMFGALDAFHDRSYLRKHSRGTLKTRDGRKLKLHVYACLKADARDRTIFDVTQEWRQKRKALKQMAKEDHERVLALSTCMDAESAERTVVLASVS